MRKIVSLTSYGERLNKTLPLTLKSISEMLDFNPDIIVLYLAEKDYNNFDKSLLEQYDNLIVRVVDDIKSFKKYYALTESEFENDMVFIADDDIKFSGGTWITLKSLYDKYKDEEQKYIYAKGCTTYYEQTKTYKVAENDKPYDKFLFWSGCGLLIPPQTMRFDKKLIENMYGYAQNNHLSYISDDKFMSSYCIINGIKCICAYSKQTYLDFDGNAKLMDLRSGGGKSKLHWQEAQMFFKTPEAEKIIVSITTNNQNIVCDRIVDLFEKQTLKPDKVILTLNENDSIKRKLNTLTKDYNLVIQKTNYNPSLKKWIPDGVDDNDLLFIIDDETSIDATLLENMFCEYFSPHRNRGVLKYIKGFGHRHLINPHKEVVRAGQTKGLDLNEDADIEDMITKVIVINKKNN